MESTCDMGPPDLVDSSLRNAYFNADDGVLGVGYVDARQNNDDTGSVGVDDEWYAMPLSKAEVERGNTKALLKKLTLTETEERLSRKATRSHGDVLRRVEAGDEVVIVIVQIMACGVHAVCGAVRWTCYFGSILVLVRFNIGSGHPKAFSHLNFEWAI